jgi:DNA-directed RNA polymerase specialized sigma24 family protein
MPEDAEGSITQFFSKLRAGDPAGAEQLWGCFFPRLLGLARKTLAGLPQQVADADDAVQSAFVSFWQRAKAGDFGPTLDRNELWKLLGTITLRKALKQARHEKADKRGGGRVVGEHALTAADGSPQQLDSLVGQVPTRDFDLACEELLGQLDEELHAYALLRLLGYRNREIAQMHDCTERKVERKLNLIRLQWEQTLRD